MTLTYRVDPRWEIVRAVQERDGTQCFYCGLELGRYGVTREVLEHVTPRDRGSDSIENLVLACNTCNRRKRRLPGWLFVIQQELATWEQKRYREHWLQRRTTPYEPYPKAEAA